MVDQDGADHPNSAGVSSLFFTSGLVVDRKTVVVPAQYNALPDENMTRVMLKFGEDWYHHDVDDDSISSVTLDRDEMSVILLGRHGLVKVGGGGGQPFTLDNLGNNPFRYERVPSADYGELLCVRDVTGLVAACGQSRQVYRRAGANWVRMDTGMRKMAAASLEGIDGTGPSNIFAVGDYGTILHYDGSRWIELDSPTNRPLAAVRCAAPDEVYVCGNDGILLKGNRNAWQILASGEFSSHFWDLEVFDGKIWVAHSQGVLRYDGTTVEPVDLQLGKMIGHHKLHAADDILWSFGVDDLCYFDGRTWREVICPENV
jgi:hypothetical protein